MSFVTQRNARDVESNLHGSSMQIDAFNEQIAQSVKEGKADFFRPAEYDAGGSISTNENFSLIIEILASITPH